MLMKILLVALLPCVFAEYVNDVAIFAKKNYTNGDSIIIETASALKSGDRLYINFLPIPISKLTLNLRIELKEVNFKVNVNGCSSLSKTPLDKVPAASTMWRVVRKSDRIMIWADNVLVGDLVFKDDWRSSCEENWSAQESTHVNLDARYTTAGAVQKFGVLPAVEYVNDVAIFAEKNYKNGDSIIIKTESALKSEGQFYIDFLPIPKSKVTLNLKINLNEQVNFAVTVNGCSDLSKTLYKLPAASNMWRVVRKSDRIMIWADNVLVGDLVFKDDRRPSCGESWSAQESTHVRLRTGYTTAGAVQKFGVVPAGVHLYSFWC